MPDLMTPRHERWDEFYERLVGPGFCDFKKDSEGEISWTCKAGNDKTFATKILQEMGFSAEDIAYSVIYFEQYGG